MCMFCRSLFVLFLLAIVLSVLRYTNSDNPFGIFKVFQQRYSGNASWYFWVDGNMCSYFFLYSCIVIKDSIVKLGVMIPWIPLIGLIRPYYLPIAMGYQMFEVRVGWFFILVQLFRLSFNKLFSDQSFWFLENFIFVNVCHLRYFLLIWKLLNVIKWYLNIYVYTINITKINKKLHFLKW
jgi:hypothetical protein